MPPPNTRGRHQQPTERGGDGGPPTCSLGSQGFQGGSCTAEELAPVSAQDPGMGLHKAPQVSSQAPRGPGAGGRGGLTVSLL